MSNQCDVMDCMERWFRSEMLGYGAKRKNKSWRGYGGVTDGCGYELGWARDRSNKRQQQAMKRGAKC